MPLSSNTTKWMDAVMKPGAKEGTIVVSMTKADGTADTGTVYAKPPYLTTIYLDMIRKGLTGGFGPNTAPFAMDILYDTTTQQEFLLKLYDIGGIEPKRV